ncbi:MAG: hypothetical protein JRJ12_04365 [Deltaproteobacteria bacterium]|nr:hypothetical protein [Deltaproteobacteria bacterium]MBW2070529.1 hypothetical protein [Deltaproteobacteria bacterium]
MATQKIAITVPPHFLERLDMWAKRAGKPRSRFVVEQMEKRLQELEDEYVTELYNRAYGDNESAKENSELAEEMLSLSPVPHMEEKW